MITHFPKAQLIIQYYVCRGASNESLQPRSISRYLISKLVLAHNAICYKNHGNGSKASLMLVHYMYTEQKADSETVHDRRFEFWEAGDP